MHLAQGYTSSVNGSYSFFMPGFSLLSSYVFDESMHFIVVLYLTMAFLSYRALSRYVKEEEAAHSIEAFEEAENCADPKAMTALRLARTTLNAWEFGSAGRTNIENQQSSITTHLMVILAEDKKQEKISLRTKKQWRDIYIRRAVGITLNILLIVIQWTGIVLLTLFSEKITNLSALSFLGAQAALVVPVAISIINAVLPFFTLKITVFERWDSTATAIQVELVRLYISRVLNAFIVAFQYVQLLTQNSISSGSEVKADDGWNKCYEDQTAYGFLTLVISDWVLQKVIVFVSTHVYSWMGKCAKKEACCGKFLRQEFALSSECIQIMYSQVLMWILLPYFPMISLLIGVAHWSTFKFMKWMLGRYFEKPQGVDAKDTGRVVSILYLATLTVCLLTHIFFLSGNVDRYNGCSPFFETDNVLYNASSSQGTFFTEQPADTIAAESIGSHVIIAILVNRYFLLSIIILMALFMLRAQRYNKAFLKYVDHKALDINRLKQEMETDLKRLGKENKMLKMQLRSGLSPVGVNP